jgi:hypothetical protein
MGLGRRLHLKDWNGTVVIEILVGESFLVWPDSSFLRLGPLIFQADARRDQSRLAACLAATRRGLAFTDPSTTAGLVGPRLGSLLRRRQLVVDRPDEG